MRACLAGPTRDTRPAYATATTSVAASRPKEQARSVTSLLPRQRAFARAVRGRRVGRRDEPHGLHARLGLAAHEVVPIDGVGELVEQRAEPADVARIHPGG